MLSPKDSRFALQDNSVLALPRAQQRPVEGAPGRCSLPALDITRKFNGHLLEDLFRLGTAVVDEFFTCHTCHGDKTIAVSTGLSAEASSETCPTCKGSGTAVRR